MATGHGRTLQTSGILVKKSAYICWQMVYSYIINSSFSGSPMPGVIAVKPCFEHSMRSQSAGGTAVIDTPVEGPAVFAP